MNTIWNELKLQDSISYYIGGGWGEDDYKEELKPAFVIRGTDMPYIRDGYYNEIPFRFHKVSNISKRILEENDIILEVSGGSKDQLVGRSIIVKKDLLNFLSPSAICASFCKLIRPDKNVVYPKFLYMWLRTIYSNGEIGKYQIQSTGISNFQFEAFIKHAKIQLPDLPTQKRIAEIFSAYDDLIENNNHRIALLEKAAQELYKEWFVRFRFPGYENAKFENGLPEGWKRKKISAYYDTCSGGTPSRTHEEYFEEGIYPWVKTGEIKDCIIIDTEEYITKEAVKKSSAKLLPARSVAMAMYGVNIGQLGYFDKQMTCNQACCVFSDKRSFSSKHYLFQYLKSIREYLLLISFGAAQQNLSQELIKKIKIVMPSDDVVRAFEEKVDAIYDSIKTLMYKNQNLAKQRDLLLPRLMSGKLDV